MKEKEYLLKQHYKESKKDLIGNFPLRIAFLKYYTSDLDMSSL